MELVTTVFEYLSPAELRRVATLSRNLRAAARYAGLYFHHSCWWEIGTPWVAKHSAMKDFVTHAADNDLRISLQVHCFLPRNDPADSDVVAKAEVPLSCFIAAIATAIPCLVSLAVRVPDDFWAQFDPALCTPAPHLRDFVIGTGITLQDIPVVRYFGDKTPDTLAPTWNASPGSLCMRALVHLDENSMESFEFVVVPKNRACRRIFRSEDWTEEWNLVPIFRCALFSANVTYFRTDDRFLYSFMRSSGSFNALRDLRFDIDFSRRDPPILWGASWPINCTDSNFCVTCPVLETVTLFALDRRGTIQSLEAAHFGYSLGQTVRRKDSRARLILVGVKFDRPDAISLLGMAFSSIERRPFVGLRSSEDWDSGLWDC
ncbi:hypothetical protein AURDEDRAFT_162682 [Auricularia subglabra TFB-10046 SS5]|nr:hypothetical protein AURDEDRAFT_162682 [Auricularia subglabra TFB-10046 SS5]